MELGGEHRHIRILVNNPPGSSRGAEQVDQDDVLLRNLVLLQHLHCFADFVARAHDWVEQEHLSVGNVIRELCINHMFLVGVTVRVDQDLSNPQGATTVLECFFHCFPGPKTHRGYSNTHERTFEGGVIEQLFIVEIILHDKIVYRTPDYRHSTGALFILQS